MGKALRSVEVKRGFQRAGANLTGPRLPPRPKDRRGAAFAKVVLPESTRPELVARAVSAVGEADPDVYGVTAAFLATERPQRAK